MDFSWDQESRDLHRRMKELGTEVAALPSDDRMGALARAGALGLSLPTEHGGGGHSLVTTAHAYEGLGSTLDDGGLLLAAGAHLFGVAMTIAKVGSDAQRAEILPALARGERIATVAATEPEAGSDVAASATVFTPGGDGFRVTGEKPYVTWSDRADLFLVVGRRTNDRGLTCAVADRADGVVSKAPYETAGLSGARLGPVRFDDAALPADRVLGRVGAGMAVFQTAMAYERALVLAFRLGAMQRQLDEAQAFAKTRRVGGTRIAEHQAVAHRIARMHARLEAARLLTYKAAWAVETTGRGQCEAAVAKWQLAEAAVASALDALRLRGGRGYLSAERQPEELLDTLGGTVHSGTEDVLANIVAAWLGVR